jgi:chemotaxis protein MotB
MNDGTPIIIKKKKVQSHGHHGGSWKVAYADFVTAMMAFFMVMWIMGMSAETRSMVAGYFNDPNGFIKNPPKSRTPFAIPGSPSPRQGQGGDTMNMAEKSDQEEIKKIETKLEEAIGSDASLRNLFKNMEMSITEEGLRIEFMEASGSVFFETGRAVIRPDAKRLIAKVAPLLAQSGRTMVVEGHTDAMPYAGANYDNLNLSTDRALAMKRALQGGGVTLKQIAQVRGYAANKLRKPDKPLDFSNRRVTVLIPFHVVADSTVDLPADVIKGQIEGVFRKPIEVAPDPPKIRE